MKGIGVDVFARCFGLVYQQVLVLGAKLLRKYLERPVSAIVNLLPGSCKYVIQLGRLCCKCPNLLARRSRQISSQKSDRLGERG